MADDPLRRLPGTALRVRRSHRRDLARLVHLLDATSGARLERAFRRIVGDLGSDVYVAEAVSGEIVGVVSVVYARSLLRGGVSALLDGARARHQPVRPVLEGLVAFAEDRARRRGCQRLAAWVDAADVELRETLLARGYRAGELLVTDLRGAA